MLDIKLIVFVLIVCAGVLGRDTRRGNTKHRQVQYEYKYNHPPVPENYEAIPVAVVYEDQNIREDKAIKNDVTQGSHVKDVFNETPNSGTIVTKEQSGNEVVNDKNPTQPEQLPPKATTYRPPYIQKEQQIPVAVVYEPETITYQKPSQNSRATIDKRTNERPTPEEKETGIENNDSPNVPTNGHIGTESIPSENSRNILNRRKSSRPVPLRKTDVEDNTPSRVQNVQTEYSNPIPTPDQPKEIQTRRRAQNPTTREMETTVENKFKSSVPENQTPLSSITTEKTDNLTNRRVIRPTPSKPTLAQEKLASFDDDSTSEQQNENPPSVQQAEKLETFKNTEYSEQFPKRGNSTRIRDVVPIVQSENVVYSQSGNFKYSYEGGDGTKAFEEGELKTFDDETAGEAVSGGFSYVAKDGNEYSLSYTADENGYRPVGAHLPTPPPIPPAIARALAYLATKTTPEPITESIAEYDQ